MAKFELSINVKYLPEWGVWEGVRELIQNGKDAEVEFNAPLTVDWKNGTLRIENEGATLSREALLFGTTSKMGRADLIGKFGEGLKLGVLALVRAGRSVTIRSGSEVWDPAIARSEKYNADVLVFDIKGNREDKNRVRVEIDGVSEEDYNEYRERFLFLNDKRRSEKSIVKTQDGDLLLHDAQQGRIFVKGIFVQNMPGLAFGYNFRDAELDRDRKMVASYDRDKYMALILAEAATKRAGVMKRFIAMLSDLDAKDTAGINEWRVSDMDDALIDEVVTQFKREHGDDAIPVATMAEATDIEHYGKRGVVCGQQLRAVLQCKLGSFEKVKASLRTATSKQYSPHQLTNAERQNLREGCRLVAIAIEGSWEDVFSRIDVVDFRDDEFNGMAKDGRVQVAKRLLCDADETLRVLVHEFAHDAGADGDKSHVATIERYWMRIVRYLRTSKTTK